MNKDLEQFSEEELKFIESKASGVKPDELCFITSGAAAALARIALAAKQAKPVTMDSLRDAVAEMSGGLPMEWKEGNDKGHHAVPFINFNSLHRIVTKFTTPQPAHTEQVIPEGCALVPIEPTEDMVINGFESKPNEIFSPDGEWESYEAMSGCEQAAHRAKLCWAAMLAAAPKPEVL